MSDADLQAQVAAAEAYEAIFVPSLIGEWAPRVLEAAGVQPRDRVLDVACGTGVVARAALPVVGEAGRVAGADANPGMLAVARARAPEVEWHLAPAERLPFGNHEFDVVACQFGLMFFTDRQRALREMLRVCRPGGRLGIAVWDEIEHTPGYAAELALLDRMAGSAAADALRAPFVLGSRDRLASLIAITPMRDVVITTRPGTARFQSIRVLVEADLRGWLPLMGVHLPEPMVLDILDAAERELEPWRTADGSIRFESPAHIVVGTAP